MVSTQVKSHNTGLPNFRVISATPIGIFPSSRFTLNGSKIDAALARRLPRLEAPTTHLVLLKILHRDKHFLLMKQLSRADSSNSFQAVRGHQHAVIFSINS